MMAVTIVARTNGLRSKIGGRRAVRGPRRGSSPPIADAGAGRRGDVDQDQRRAAEEHDRL